MPRLSDPITIRGMEVKNRLWFPPMLSFSSTPEGCPSKASSTVYEQRAKGGVGLITYEAASVDPNSFLGNGAYLGVDDNIPCYKNLTDLIHKYDVKIGIQLAENGIIQIMAKVLFGAKTEVIGPSNIDPYLATSAYEQMIPNWKETLKEKNIEVIGMDLNDISHFQDQFALAAGRAIQAGFDFVEIHSAHGTLHAAFLAPYYNKRTDEYGGSLENRTKFVVETVKKVRKQIGDKPPIFVRISADELLEDGNRIEEGKKISQILEKAGVDCLDVSQGNMIRSPQGIQIPTYYEPGAFIHLAEAIKKVVTIPVIGVGRIVDPRMADEFIQRGKADSIYMGRQLICDSNTPKKYFTEQLDDIRLCMGCLQGCNVAPQTCVLDSFSGRNYKEIEPTTEPKKIVILGAGIAGMEAARVAKMRGHDVSIYEKADKIGGIMPLVAMEYGKKDFINIVNYLEVQLRKLNVPIHFNKVLSKDEIADLKPDALVLAIGTEEILPDNLKDNPNVLMQEEALLKTKPMGKNLVVRGLNTYWKGGAETALTLCEEGYNIKALMGPAAMVAMDIVLATGRRFMILDYLREKNIPIYPKAKLLEVTEKGVKFLDKDGQEQFIEADNFIFCGARKALGKELKKSLKEIAPKVVAIGDGKKPGDIKAAMKDAEAFARKI